MSCPEVMCWDSWVFWKKQSVEIWDWTKRVEIWDQLGLGGAPPVIGSDGTVCIIKIVLFCPRVENLKVKKVIKVLYLNQESRQCFVLLDSYAWERFYVYSNILYIRILWLYYSCRIHRLHICREVRFPHGPSLMPTGLSAVRCRLATRVTLRQLPSPGSFVQFLLAFPHPLSVKSRSWAQAFV